MGVFGKDAIGRITHIQKLEKILKFLTNISVGSTLTQNDTETLEKAKNLIKSHLKKVLNDPFYLKSLTDEHKKRTI